MNSNIMEDSQEMVGVAVAEFIVGTPLPTDIFMKLGDRKFVLISKAGDRTNFSTLSAIKRKSVQEVYVKKSEYAQFVSQTLKFVSFTQNNKSFRVEHKTFFLRSATSAIFKQVENLGPSQDVVNYAKSISNSTIEMVADHRSLNDIIKGLSLASPDVFNMSIAVSAFSVMIAKQLNWRSRITMDKLALGGLLSDIGLKELSPELINKHRSDMTFEEIQQFEEHPYRGLKMLETVDDIPDDVLSIVYEHHENSAGMGYPRKLRELRQNPLAKVVALATQFCELTVATPRNENPRSVPESLHYIQEVMGQPFNKEAFEALKALVERDLAAAG